MTDERPLRDVLREVEESRRTQSALWPGWGELAVRCADELRAIAPLLRHHADVIQAVLRMSADGYIHDPKSYDEECCRARALADELEAM